MTPIDRILCPVDLSECSQRALDYALAIARRYGASVSVLHVSVVEPMPVRPFAGPVVLERMGTSAFQRDQIATELRTLIEREAPAGVRVDSVVVEGDVADVILAQAGALSASLLVIGSHGRSGLGRLVLGSVAEKVIRQAACPVLTVPPHAPAIVPASRCLFPQVLCAFDYSEGAERALAFALSMTHDLGGHLTVLHVSERPPEEKLPPFEHEYYDTTEYLREYQQAALARLMRKVPEPLRSSGEVDAELAAGHPAREILRVAVARHANLIVMGVERRGGVDLALFGSTTRQVVQQATCPILTLRAA